MEFATSDVLSVLNYLLPGLVATWAFRRLTPHDKPKDLDAVIEALLFTAAVQPLLLITEAAALWTGSHWFSISPWTEKGAFVISVVLGLSTGIVTGIAANKDWVHHALRKFKLTKQTSFPSEWYRHLFCDERYVILTMKNGDRIMGWPAEFPNSPARGHFSLREAQWLMPTGETRPLSTAECILIPATEVLYLEFMKFETETPNES